MRDAAGDCPWRVYVYSLTGQLADNGSRDMYTLRVWRSAPASMQRSLSQAFGHHYKEPYGASYDGGLYETHQYALTPILEHRLRFSRCRTHDPTLADIFYAPVLPMPRLNFRNAEYPKLCRRLSVAEVSRQLHHLRSPAAACRHVISHGRRRRCRARGSTRAT